MHNQKSKIKIQKCLVLFLALAFSAAACAADPVKPEKDDNALPLSLYQKIKAHFDAMYGARSGLISAAPASKQEVEKALRADAAANKDVLLKALDSKSALHRQLAASALEYCGDPKTAVAALCKTLTADSEADVRRAAASGLAKLPDAAAVEALLKALTDSADSVRGVAATALGNIKDNRAADGLLRLLASDPQPIIRMQAATALSKIKDPATLEPLKKALENEKDERVKLAIAGALRNLLGNEAAKADAMPTADEAAKFLAALAKEMKEVEDKLRNDRHDQAVQAQGAGIEQKLTQFIEKLSQMSSPGSSSGDKKGDKQQQQQQQTGNQGGKQPTNPLKQSQLGSAVPPGALNPAVVAGQQDAWARLPPALRDELTQSYRPEIPLRWQKRLEAYFYSLNAEEAKEMDK